MLICKRKSSGILLLSRPSYNNCSLNVCLIGGKEPRVTLDSFICLLTTFGLLLIDVRDRVYPAHRLRPFTPAAAAAHYSYRITPLIMMMMMTIMK